MEDGTKTGNGSSTDIKDPELEKLQKEAKKQELLASIATKKKEALEASMPSTTTALEAKTDVDTNVQIEAQILAYRMLDRVAESIANQVAPLAGKAILIHNAADLAALGTYRAFNGQMNELLAEYRAIAPSVAGGVQPAAIIAGVVAVTAAVKTVIDLIGLFRTQHDIKGVAIEMDDLPLMSQVAGRLSAKPHNKKVFVSQLYPLTLDPKMSTTIQKQLDDVRQAAAEAAARVNGLEGAAKEAAAARLKQADDIRTGYEDALTKVAAADTATLLSALLRGAVVETLLANAHVLYLKAIKAGGANETTRHLVGSNVKHSGGVIVNFMLFDKDGSVLLASTVSGYSGELKVVSP